MPDSLLFTAFSALRACGGAKEALYYLESFLQRLEFETDMRWYVEVSRVGENSVADEYCVEAKQWQAALQEARKLRGDTGALSKFSIELLDRGYRAVDPALKLRYLINEAPLDATLSDDTVVAKVEAPSGKPLAVEPLAPTAFTTSVAPAAAISNGVPRPASQAPPRPNSVSAPRSVAVAAPPRSLHLVVVPDDEVPPAPRLPGGLGPLSEAPAVQLPVFELVRERAEEPRADSPITYREVAYAVPAGTARSEIEALLHDRYQAVRAAIASRPAGKFVQLAVFDHVFQRRPERPPLATFVWKDWRGEPVQAFPGFGEAPQGPQSRVPPASESLLPAARSPSSAPPATNLSILPPPPSPAPRVTASVTPASVPLVPMAPVVLSSPPAAALATSAQAAPVAAQASSSPAGPAPAPLVAPSFDLNFESPAFNSPSVAPPVAARKSPSDRPSRPRLAVERRRIGEDLIGELFEIMHELHFARDVAAGAEFVLSVLNEVLPCEGALIHVFDINTSHFVVVRAKGPNASSVLLQRMSDQDPLVTSVMRSPRALSIKDSAHDARVNGPRWHALGVAPTVALCGAVQQGGRYLGLIELVNPQGGTPFHQSELNALDYICQQFAEFLSKKPIVLTADVVLARS